MAIQNFLKKEINLFTWIFAFFVVLGIVCRFVLLGVGYEYDEIFTAVAANPALSWFYIVKHYLIVDCHPPLYNFLMWLYNHCVPYGPEWVARLPSVFFSLISLWVSWKFFPKFLGKTARWIFLLLLSSNIYLIFYSQQARSYMLTELLAIGLTFLYIQMARRIWHRKEISAHQWGLYGIVALLLCYTHYFGAFAFGIFSIILFVLACIYKQEKRWFIWVPFLVCILFLPWLFPNLLHNISLERFNGNWWGNTNRITWGMFSQFPRFFFSSFRDCIVIFIPFFASLFYVIKKTGSFRKIPWVREYVLLCLPFLLSFGIILLAYTKIFLLMSRYFIPFSIGIYLTVSGVIATSCRRHKWLEVLFLVGLISQFYTFSIFMPALYKGEAFSARATALEYQRKYSDKELFVVAFEGFPKESFEPMYAYYPQVRLGMTQPVTELLHLSEAEREEVLKRKDKAIVYLPNCHITKIRNLGMLLQREVIIEYVVGTSCFLSFSEKKNYPVYMKDILIREDAMPPNRL